MCHGPGRSTIGMNTGKGVLILNYRLRKKLAPLIFIGPFLVIFLFFMVYPIVYSVILSFARYRSGDIVFIGLKNYTYILTDPLFYQSLENTFIIFLIQVPIMTVLALIVGNLLNSTLLKAKGLFRMFIFMPVLIDTVSYSIVFSLIFRENGGFANNMLGILGIQPLHWLSVGYLAKAVIIVAVTWRWTGYNSVIMLSGLQNVPGELYEAASIDGASAVVKFIKITIPELKPVIVFSIINSINGTLQLFTEPNLLTGNGGPVNKTLTMVLYLYNTGFKSFNFGVASAGSYVLAIIIVVLALVQLRLTREKS